MKPLLDVIFRSEKRKNTLLFLKEDPKDMELILRHMGTTRQALLPQIRILEDHSLVSDSGDIYELTTIGKLIVDGMVPLMGTVSVLDNDIEYWGTYKFDFIPYTLLKKICELKGFVTVQPSVSEMFELNKEFTEYSKKSESVYKVSNFFHPDFPAFFSELTDNRIRVSLILTGDAFNKLRSERSEDYEMLVKNDLINLFVYPKELEFITYAYNDHCVLMRLLRNNGEMDSTHIICSDSDAIEWGKELFEYFMKESIPLQ